MTFKCFASGVKAGAEGEIALSHKPRASYHTLQLGRASGLAWPSQIACTKRPWIFLGSASIEGAYIGTVRSGVEAKKGEKPFAMLSNGWGLITEVIFLRASLESAVENG